MRREREDERRKMTVVSLVTIGWWLLMKRWNWSRLGLGWPWSIQMVLSKRQVEMFQEFGARGLGYRY